MQSSWLPVSRRVWSSCDIVNREVVSVRFACVQLFFFLRARARFCASGSLTALDLSINSIGDEGAKAFAAAVAASGSLTLKKLVVPAGLERHAELRDACRSKGVELV